MNNHNQLSNQGKERAAVNAQTNNSIDGPGAAPGGTTSTNPVPGGVRGTTSTENPSAGDCTVRTGTEIPEEIKNLRKKVDTSAQLGKRIEVLEGVERDYPGTKKAYQDAHAQLVRDDENLRDYFDSEKTKLKTRLGTTQAEKVEKLVKDRNDRTTGLEQDVDSARTTLGRAASPLELHDQAVKDRTAELNAWKNLTATVTAQYGEHRKAREEIIKARQEGHYGLAYGLLLIAQNKQDARAQKGPRLVKPEDLHKEFHFAAEDLASAQQNLAKAQEELDKDKTAFAAANKYLEEHRKTSEAILLADLVDIRPPEDDTTQQSGGTQQQPGGTQQQPGGTQQQGDVTKSQANDSHGQEQNAQNPR